MKHRKPLRAKKGLGSQGLSQAFAIPVFGNGLVNIIFVTLAIVLIAISTIAPQGFSGIRTTVTDMSRPLLATIVKPITNAADVVRNVSGLAELQAENVRLLQENMKLKEWYQTALLLEAENKSLKDLLNVKIDPQYKTITARVLADSGNAFVKSLLVSVGSQDGVKKGQAVMSGDGVIGRIIEVGEKTSRILLITDINSRVPVLIEDTRQHAVLAGDNLNAGKLLHLPVDTTLRENARIITSGHGGLFPAGLPIGRVKMEQAPGVHVEPFTDFNRIVHVRIIDSLADLNLIAGPGHLN